ncbi:hypothetical protein K457DRAFT_177732 [Linnemannia elongata AG-77]|uniref:Transmembrane protein n=1 Tax=Linnemannia elongata AG-77 TaxID=1314771 RepID=A0A197KGP4_9FUNG|nr:hypothetical protein K457DRAFT_177732 [Linnemannia elongata AG-77]
MIMLDEHTLFRCLSTPCGLSSFLPPLSRRKASSRLSWSSLDSLPPALPHRLILTVLFFFINTQLLLSFAQNCSLFSYFSCTRNKNRTHFKPALPHPRIHPPTNTTPDILFFSCFPFLLCQNRNSVLLHSHSHWPNSLPSFLSFSIKAPVLSHSNSSFSSTFFSSFFIHLIHTFHFFFFFFFLQQ